MLVVGFRLQKVKSHSSEPPGRLNIDLHVWTSSRRVYQYIYIKIQMHNSIRLCTCVTGSLEGRLSECKEFDLEEAHVSSILINWSWLSTLPPPLSLSTLPKPKNELQDCCLSWIVKASAKDKNRCLLWIVKARVIYGYRCDERLKTNVEESTRLACTLKRWDFFFLVTRNLDFVKTTHIAWGGKKETKNNLFSVRGMAAYFCLPCQWLGKCIDKVCVWPGQSFLSSRI